MGTPQTVTVLFTSLGGWTELASSVTPEAANEVRRTHFSSLRRALTASDGTEVKSLGDGIMAVFRAASSGLNCAVAMQQAVDRLNDPNLADLGLRVGLSCGEATKDGADYFGDPVVEAARLCAEAAGGQILVADRVRASAGRRGSHDFRLVGSLKLKGLPGVLDTYEVRWEPLADEGAEVIAVPLPPRLVHGPEVGVIGRDSQLMLLQETAKRVESGAGREVVLVAGEPGEGKTTLVAEMGRRAHQSGMTVLLGRCDEDLGLAFHPFYEALGHYVAHADADLLTSHIQSHGGELARMVPALGQRVDDLPEPTRSDPDSERYLLYGAVVGLLNRASQETPVVLILDDLHWADKPSMQVLRHLVTHSTSSRLLIVGTYREQELSNAQPLTETLAALSREAGVTRVELEGLELVDAIAFLESVAGHELDEDGVELAHALYRETDGNPFFFYELLRHLTESGAIVQDERGLRVADSAEGVLALPESVREVVGARVSSVGESASTVLTVAAVIGRDFDLDLLAEVTGTDEDDLIDVLEKAEGAALIREASGYPGRYSFSHALIQHTIYEDLGATRRARAHLAVAEALERLGGVDDRARVGELARHYRLAAQPSHLEKAISYARKAGEAALGALAPDDAVRYFSQAIELGDRVEAVDEPGTIELLIGLGTAERQAGDPNFRAVLLEAAHKARELGDTDRLVRAALANNRGYFSSLGRVDADKVDVLEAALDALAEVDSPDRARLLSILCSEHTFGSLDRRLASAHEAKAMARRLEDPSTLVGVINDCALALQMPSALEEQLADCREALGLAEGLGDPFALFWAAVMTHVEANRSGHFDLAARCLSAAGQISEKIQQPVLIWSVSLIQAGQALLLGDPAAAEERANFALTVGTQSGQPDAFPAYGAQLAAVRAQQGRLGELVPLIEEIARQNPSVASYRAALAIANLEAGDNAAALELVEAAMDSSFDFPADAAWLDTIMNYAHAVVQLNVPPAAAQLLELLGPYHDQVPYQGLVPGGPIAAVLGGLATVLGRYPDAEAAFEEATEVNTRGGMRYSEAQTQLLWGRMLTARAELGDADQARKLLGQAGATAADRGYALVERHARAAVEQAGNG